MKTSDEEIRIKFRLRLNIESWGRYRKGDEDDFVISVFDEANGLVRFPIDKRWDIISHDLVKPKKAKPIEERKQDFIRSIEEVGISCTSGISLIEFIDYWTEHNENGKLMRFEMKKNQPFNIGRRIGTWKRNNFNNGKSTKPTTDEAVNGFISQ